MLHQQATALAEFIDPFVERPYSRHKHENFHLTTSDREDHLSKSSLIFEERKINILQMITMEMQQLLDIPTGNEPAVELCRKLEAVEMMLKGFHGEILEVTEVLDVLVTLHHFLSDSFIRSKDPFVRLSTGNCLIQLWTLPGSGQRITNSDLQVLQSFLMSSVSLLKDPEADWYDMSLEHVRSLHTSKALCFVRFVDDLEFVVDWSSNLFSRVFTVVKKTTAVAINQLQLLLQTVVSDLVQVNEVEPVLDVIYTQILDHAENPTAFEFSVNLLRACRRDLELPTQQFFVNHLQSKPSSSDLDIVFRKFELMRTLYCACPQLVATAVGGLQNCLEATTLDESSVDLVLMLSKMFAVTGSNLAQDCRHLWFSFLRSLRHGNKQVQLLGLGEMTNIICNHPELIPICWKYFMAHCVREGSPDVIQNVFDCLEAASCGFNISLIDYVVQVMKEMVSDSSVGLRERALKVLTVILEKLLFSPMNTKLTQKCIEIMSIFSNYYQFGDNRAKSFTQKLFVGYVIPFALPAEERVLRLLNFWLFMSQDMRALFHDIQRNSFFFRKRVHEALKLCEERNDDRTKSLLLAHVVWVSEKLDRPDSRLDYLALEELFLHLGRNRSYLEKLKIIADQVSCSIDDRVSAMNELLDTLKTRKKDMVPVVDQLCTKLMVNYFDKNSFKILLQWVHHCIINKQTPIRISYTPHEMAMEGLKLIFELLFSSPHLAFDSSSVTKLMEMLEATSSPGVSYTAMVLKVLAVTSMHKSFKTEYPELFDEHLLPLLKMYVVSGTPEESKYAVQTLAYHLGSERLGTLQKLLMEVFEKAKLQDDHYLTLISTAAYLNAFMPWDAAVSFRKILPQFFQIVFSPQLLSNLLFTKEAIARHKEAFVNGHSPLIKQVCVNRILQCRGLPNGDFYEKDEVPSCTKCLKAAVKTASGLITTMAHLTEDPHKSLNMKQRHCELLTLMCLNEMHSSLQAPLRDEDKACLRLTAGTAMLKLCQWPSFWDAMPVESFVALSHLMMDGVKDVRLKLCRKLTKVLTAESSGLPVDFLAFYAVALLEEDKGLREEIKGMLKVAMTAKRNVYRHCIYITNECNTFDELVEKKPELLVENCLVVAIFLLAHNPLFYSAREAPVLHDVEEALATLLAELQEGKFKLTFEAYEDILMRLQHLRSSLVPESDDVHNKIFVASNVVLHCLEDFRKQSRKNLCEIPIPLKYFQALEDS